MQVETTILAQNLPAYAEQARRLEEIGYDSVVTPEAGHDPFLPLTVVAEHTQRIKFGTAVAIAFPRRSSCAESIPVSTIPTGTPPSRG